MNKPALALAVLLSSVPPAFASDAESDLADAITLFGKRTEDLIDYQSKALEPSRFAITGCHDAIASAAKAGVIATADQTRTCAQFVARYQLAEAEAALSDAQDWLFFLSQIDMATNHEENGKKMIVSAQRCLGEMNRLLAAGMPTTIAIRVGRTDPQPVTMADARTKVCEPLAKAAATFAKDVGTARTQREAAIAAPYKAAGISGDRLALLTNHIDYAMYGRNGAPLRTPQQLKTASVIFELLGPSTHGLWTLRRYQFSGDKLLATTSADFIARPAPRYFR